MRYAWIFPEIYFGGGVKRFIARLIIRRLREWDRRTSDRVHRFVAISKNVQKRIEECYGRQADVVYPPVDTSFFTPSDKGKGYGTYPERGYDLVVSALVPYKRVDLAVKAYSQIGFPLIVVGSGSEFKKIRKYAGNNIKFTGWVSNEELLQLYRGCRMVIFPGEEDFGLVPLEAQACGKPVVAFAKGGVLESVVDGVTGIFFKEQTVSSLIEAVKICSERRWDCDVIRANAERFNVDSFIRGIKESISRCMTSDTSVKLK
jgi:glycosyltransferase involved in cell wall biosynthesis